MSAHLLLDSKLQEPCPARAYDSSRKGNGPLPSSHIFQKHDKTGEISFNNSFSLIQYIRNTISKVMDIKLTNKIVHILFCTKPLKSDDYFFCTAHLSSNWLHFLS